MRRMDMAAVGALCVLTQVQCSSYGEQSGDDASAVCGDVKTVAAPVVNGEESWDSEVVPLTAAQAMAIGWVDLGEGTHCTGTLVGPFTVLTAAHCFVIPPIDVAFHVGRDGGDPEHVYEASSYEANPDFTLIQPGRDIAFVTLVQNPVEDGVEPIPVDLEPGRSLVGEKVEAVGYGQTSDEDVSNTRRWWTVLDVTNENENLYTTSSGEGAGMCFGDSGGPLLWNDPERGPTLCGILTAIDEVDGCLGNNYYARTNAEANHDFLDEGLPDDACGLLGVDAKGRCTDEGHAVWCEGGRIKDRDCAACGEACGWLSDEAGYYCIGNE